MESYAPILGMIVVTASSILLLVSISGLIYSLRPRSEGPDSQTRDRTE